MKSILFFTVIITFSIQSFSSSTESRIKCGDENLEEYLPLIIGKKVALVTNHTAILNNKHLTDTLIIYKVNIVKIFTPEHGFRGTADAGELIDDSIDKLTGIPLISLYGKNRKPTNGQLDGVDVVLFDIQDVGVRFFTYLSTMHYVLEACAENNKKLIILDRPNPNGFYVDGPVLEKKNKSFVGMHQLPVVHGMTLGELALMINGEGWLNNGIKCDLKIIKCINYLHSDKYRLKVAASPNLPDMRSVYLYPSTGLFEGTIISEGRGTCSPFQLYGHPLIKNFDTVFTPVSINGMSLEPKFKNRKCYGYSLKSLPENEMQKFTLKYIIETYNSFSDKENFFIPYFRLLAGNDKLEGQIKSGMGEAEIKQSWQPELLEFMKLREKYLLYPEQ